MSSSAQSSHLPSLGHHDRVEVGSELQQTLVELLHLELLGKQLHWNVYGRGFRSLHLYLDEVIETWRELADTVAERAVAIGRSPNGQPSAVAAAESVPEVKAEPLEDVEVLRVLVRALAETAERARSRMNRLEELDAASQDVLVTVVRALEDQLWMVRAQMP